MVSWLVAASLAAVFYTYIGYPLLVAALAKLRPLAATRDLDYRPTVAALIPVFNAAEHIDRKMESLLALDYPPDKLEILFYSDASDDGSDELLDAWAARDPRVRVFRGDARAGKPSALNRLRRETSAEVLLMTDIRQAISENALRELVAPLADPATAAVSGALVLGGDAGVGVYQRYESWIRSSEGRFRGLVGVTGALYSLRAADMEDLPADILLDDMYVPMRLRLGGRRILFAPRAVASEAALGDEREFARKVRTLAGNYQLFARLPALLSPLTNPSWLETFSHKIMRLLCPFALALLFVSTAAAALAPGPARSFFLALLGGQLAFYGLALAGEHAGRGGRIARTFVVLNAAAVVGLWRYLRDEQQITW